MRQRWAVCPNCEQWGEVPVSFKESKHFCACPSGCGFMFLTIHDPLEAMYKEAKQVVPLVVKQPATFDP